MANGLKKGKFGDRYTHTGRTPHQGEIAVMLQKPRKANDYQQTTRNKGRDMEEILPHSPQEEPAFQAP